MQLSHGSSPRHTTIPWSGTHKCSTHLFTGYRVHKKVMAETYKLPTAEYWISLALFTNVSNAGKLRSEATSGRIEAALLDPTLVGAQRLLYMLYKYTNACTQQWQGYSWLYAFVEAMLKRVLFSSSCCMNSECLEFLHQCAWCVRARAWPLQTSLVPRPSFHIKRGLRSRLTPNKTLVFHPPLPEQGMISLSAAYLLFHCIVHPQILLATWLHVQVAWIITDKQLSSYVAYLVKNYVTP